MSRKRVPRAVIYPIIKEHFLRLLGGKDVFCKFVGYGFMSRRAHIGTDDKMLFYQTGGERRIIGEATIVQVTPMTVDSAIAKFGNRLFLDEAELFKYKGLRERTERSRLLVFVLSEVKSYRNPPRLAKPLTMSGRMLTGAAYRRLTKSVDAVTR